MPNEFICLQGHQWEQSLHHTASPDGGPACCPVCGAAGAGRAKAATLPLGEPVAGTPLAATVDRPPPPEVDPEATWMSITPMASVSAQALLKCPPVNGHTILGELGRGGMGVVYKARQVKLNRLVALKMILAGGHAGSQEVARFRSEAEAVARLQHPHIVQIYEIGAADGLPYLALEFVDGGSLADRLDGTPVPFPQAAQLVETLARAVQCAHQHGIIHRDLKPANILLTCSDRPEAVPLGNGPAPARRCEPKIADFGLAKFLHGEAGVSTPGGQTQSGAILGTPSYMAPEQASGRTREVGPATDLYALGAILYELLTGRPPFKAETSLDTLLQVTKEEPVRPARLNPRVPRDLETICLKCLHKDARKRYASALDLAEDLRRFQEGKAVGARPTSWWERGVKWARRRPAAAGMLAVSCVAAVSLLAGGLWYSAQLQAALKKARQQHQEANRQHWLAEQAALKETAAKKQVENALVQSRRRLALNYLAYGEACAAAARIVTAPDWQAAAEARNEFHRLHGWLALLADESAQPALKQFHKALRRWKSGAPPPELQRKALQLAHSCREFWLQCVDCEVPEIGTQVRTRLYQRVRAAVATLARARRWNNVAHARREFWELYWGELAIVEGPAVEEVMIRLGKALAAWKQGPAPAPLSQLAQELQQACDLELQGKP